MGVEGWVGGVGTHRDLFHERRVAELLRAHVVMGFGRGVWGGGLGGWPRTETSSTSAAWPSFSGRMWSGCATGRQPSVRLMKSMSSRSTSRTTRILALACGMRARAQGALGECQKVIQ